MHSERIWIVLLLLAAILIGANLLMLAMVRGLRAPKGGFFKSFGDATRPWKKEDEGLSELSQRVRALKSQQKDDEEKTG
jgi:hypothetical protein